MEKINTLIGSWILNTTEPSLRSSIKKTRVVKVMWDEMLQRFGAENGPRYYELKAAIINCKHKGIYVATYFANLKKLWEELGNYKKFSACDCEKTVTELAKRQEKKTLL